MFLFFKNQSLHTDQKISRVCVIRLFKLGSGCFSSWAIRRSRGMRTYWLWTASLMQNLMLTFSSESGWGWWDSNNLSRRTDTCLTAGVSFHSRCTRSTSQEGRGQLAAAGRGMAAGWGHSCRDHTGPKDWLQQYRVSKRTWWADLEYVFMDE